MMPERSLVMMASSDDATTAARCCPAAFARRCSVTSRKTSTAPNTAPVSSWIREARSSIVFSAPSFVISRVGAGESSERCRCSASNAGLATGSRVSSLMVRNTSSTGRPTASHSFQPVRVSATGLSDEMQPSRSVVMTASAMLDSVIRSRSDCVRSWSVIWRSSSSTRLRPDKAMSGSRGVATRNSCSFEGTSTSTAPVGRAGPDCVRTSQHARPTSPGVKLAGDRLLASVSHSCCFHGCARPGSP